MAACGVRPPRRPARALRKNPPRTHTPALRSVPMVHLCAGDSGGPRVPRLVHRVQARRLQARWRLVQRPLRRECACAKQPLLPLAARAIDYSPHCPPHASPPPRPHRTAPTAATATTTRSRARRTRTATATATRQPATAGRCPAASISSTTARQRWSTGKRLASGSRTRTFSMRRAPRR